MVGYQNEGPESLTRRGDGDNKSDQEVEIVGKHQSQFQ